MSFILTIDTASDKAHIGLAKDGLLMESRYSESQKNHAAFLQSAVKDLAQSAKINLTDIDAVAITAGPGSYTGLRVGMASAKGLCYALQKPLIAISTLEVLADSALQGFTESAETHYFCPMIDARRMEVFTAVYDKNLKLIMDPCALILDEFSFEEMLANNKIVFFGSGAAKWKSISKSEHAFFMNAEISAASFSKHAYSYFLKNQFTDLVYSEPLYIKDFQSVNSK